MSHNLVKMGFWGFGILMKMGLRVLEFWDFGENEYQDNCPLVELNMILQNVLS